MGTGHGLLFTTLMRISSGNFFLLITPKPETSFHHSLTLKLVSGVSKFLLPFLPSSCMSCMTWPRQPNMRTNPEVEFVGTEISDRVKINNLSKWLHHLWGMTDTLFDFDWYSNHSLMHVTFISPIFHSPPSAQYHPAPPFLTLAPASGEAERVRKSCLTY